MSGMGEGGGGRGEGERVRGVRRRKTEGLSCRRGNIKWKGNGWSLEIYEMPRVTSWVRFFYGETCVLCYN